MQLTFDSVKAYMNMDRFDRDILVWLDHMMKKGRKVLPSLRAQAEPGYSFIELEGNVRDTANRYAAYPQAKYFLDETDEKLVKVD